MKGKNMLKIKFTFLATFFISLILFNSCMDNPVNGNKATQVKGQTGKELCQTCWLVVYVKYEDGTPVSGADVTVYHMPEQVEYFRETTDNNGVVSFYTSGIRLPEGFLWDATALYGIQVSHTEFSWDGTSYIEVTITIY